MIEMPEGDRAVIKVMKESWTGANERGCIEGMSWPLLTDVLQGRINDQTMQDALRPWATVYLLLYLPCGEFVRCLPKMLW